MLDPKTLTPEQLYRLQSDTWAQGADYERERIIKLLEGQICKKCDESSSSFEHIVCAYADGAVALIKGEQK